MKQAVASTIYEAGSNNRISNGNEFTLEADALEALQELPIVPRSFGAL